jgi:hypothetical protein
MGYVARLIAKINAEMLTEIIDGAGAKPAEPLAPRHRELFQNLV